MAEIFCTTDILCLKAQMVWRKYFELRKCCAQGHRGYGGNILCYRYVVLKGTLELFFYF